MAILIIVELCPSQTYKLAVLLFAGQSEVYKVGIYRFGDYENHYAMTCIAWDLGEALRESLALSPIHNWVWNRAQGSSVHTSSSDLLSPPD